MVGIPFFASGPVGNSGPYVDGVPLEGRFGLVLAMFRQALRDCQSPVWYLQLDAAYWLINVLPDLLVKLNRRANKAKLRRLLKKMIRPELAAVVSHLDESDAYALAQLVATEGKDEIALAYLHDWQP